MAPTAADEDAPVPRSEFDSAVRELRELWEQLASFGAVFGGRLAAVEAKTGIVVPAAAGLDGSRPGGELGTKEGKVGSSGQARAPPQGIKADVSHSYPPAAASTSAAPPPASATAARTASSSLKAVNQADLANSAPTSSTHGSRSRSLPPQSTLELVATGLSAAGRSVVAVRASSQEPKRAADDDAIERPATKKLKAAADDEVADGQRPSPALANIIVIKVGHRDAPAVERTAPVIRGAHALPREEVATVQICVLYGAKDLDSAVPQTIMLPEDAYTALRDMPCRTLEFVGERQGPPAASTNLFLSKVPVVSVQRERLFRENPQTTKVKVTGLFPEFKFGPGGLPIRTPNKSRPKVDLSINLVESKLRALNDVGGLKYLIEQVDASGRGNNRAIMFHKTELWVTQEMSRALEEQSDKGKLSDPESTFSVKVGTASVANEGGSSDLPVKLNTNTDADTSAESSLGSHTSDQHLSNLAPAEADKGDAQIAGDVSMGTSEEAGDDSIYQDAHSHY